MRTGPSYTGRGDWTSDEGRRLCRRMVSTRCWLETVVKLVRSSRPSFPLHQDTIYSTPPASNASFNRDRVSAHSGNSLNPSSPLQEHLRILPGAQLKSATKSMQAREDRYHVILSSSSLAAFYAMKGSRIRGEVRRIVTRKGITYLVALSPDR